MVQALHIQNLVVSAKVFRMLCNEKADWEACRIYAAARRQSEKCRIPKAKMRIAQRAWCLLAEKLQIAMLVSMHPKHSLPSAPNSCMTRRDFLATSSAALLATAIDPASSTAAQSSSN